MALICTHDQPLDMVFEILTRTQTLQTLDTLKIVSKAWNEMMYEASFWPLLCQRTTNVSGFLLQDMQHCEYMTDFVSCVGDLTSHYLPRGMRILASCNQGILCCVRPLDRSERYQVCKPTTGQWMMIPNPKLRYRTVGHAIVVVGSSPLRYKIVRISRRGCTRLPEGGSYSYRCEIFSSQFWKWIEIQDLKLPLDELILDSRRSSPVSVGSYVHWLTSEDNVLMFNVSDESFMIFPPPLSIRNDDSIQGKRLVEYKGRLGFTCLTREGEMGLWVMENRERMIWEKKMILNGLDYSHAGFFNTELVFLTAADEAVFYDVRDCSVNKVKLRCERVHQIFQFRSDLEPVDLGQERKHMSYVPVCRKKETRVGTAEEKSLLKEGRKEEEDQSDLDKRKKTCVVLLIVRWCCSFVRDKIFAV